MVRYRAQITAFTLDVVRHPGAYRYAFYIKRHCKQMAQSIHWHSKAQTTMDTPAISLKE